MDGDGPVGGREPAAETRGGDRGHAVRQPDQVHVGVVDRDELGERPVVGEPRLALPLAHLLLAREARGARAARAHERHGDLRRRAPSDRTCAPDLDDDPRQLVPGHVRERDVVVVPLPAVPVGAADAGRRDPQDDPVVGAGRRRDLAHGRRDAELGDHHGTHERSSSPTLRTRGASTDRRRGCPPPASPAAVRSGGRRRARRGPRAHRPTRSRPRPSTEDSSATRRSIACSGCQAGRPSRDRLTAASTAIQGSRGATGASDPSASRTPARCSAPKANARSVRPAQWRSATSRSSMACSGCTLAVTPSAANRSTSCQATSWACSIDPAAPDDANASRARALAASPMAWIAQRRPWRVACAMRGASRDGGTARMPWACGPVTPSYGSWQ